MQFTGYPSDEDTQSQFGVSFNVKKEAKLKTGNSNNSVQQFFDLNPDFDQYDKPNVTDQIINNINKSYKLNAVDQNIIPSQDNTYDIGTNAKKWRNIYGHNYYDTNGVEFGFLKTITGATGGSIVFDYNDVLATTYTGQTITATSNPATKSLDLKVNTGRIQSKVFYTIGFSEWNDYVCDGTADDVQIQACVNAIFNAGNIGTIYFEEGVYNFASTLSIPRDSVISFYGKETKKNVATSAQGGVWWKGNSSLTYLIYETGASYVNVQADLGFGQRFYNMNFNASFADYAYYGLNTDVTRFYNCRFTGASISAIKLAFNGNTPLPGSESPGGLYLVNCTVGAETMATIALDIEYQTQCWIISTWFEGSGSPDYQIKLKCCDKIAIVGCEFNNTNNACILLEDTADDDCEGIAFTGCKFATGGGSTPLVEDNRTNTDSKRLMITGTSRGYVIDENDYWNATTNVIDVTPDENSYARLPYPEFASTFPSISGIGATTATYNATIDLHGSTFWVVVPTGATAPTPKQIMNGQDSTGSSVSAGKKGKTVHAEDENKTSAISGLTTVTTYDLYAITRNTSKHLSTATKKTFTTL